MNRLTGIGLRGEIILNLFLYMAMILVMMAFLLFDVSREAAVAQRIEDRREKVESIREFIEQNTSSHSGLSGVSEDPSFQNYLRSCRDSGFFKEASIFSLEGQSLLSVGNGGVPKENRSLDVRAAMEERRLITRIDQGKRGLLRDSLGEVIYSIPVRSGNEVVGGLQVVAPITETVDGVRYYNWPVLALFALFSLLAMAVISHSLSREMVKPIEEILLATKRVREGDLDQHLKIRSGNELGRVASSFNDMIATLRANQEHLDHYVASLKRANDRLKRVEDRAFQTERLTTIGRLAASVAHEVGNPLGAVYAYLEVLKKRVTGDEAVELIGKIEKETNRINEIIFGLLDLSRHGKERRETIEVNDLVKKTVSFLSSRNALAGIDCQLHLKLDLPGVTGDPRDFQQALINVVVNAVEAMPSGGMLTIRTGSTAYQAAVEGKEAEPVRREGDPLDLDFSTLRLKRSEQQAIPSFCNGQEVVFLDISDTGRGIKQEHLQKIFDPFFTMKEREGGLGLGLSICERVIQSMGGLIRVDSIWGKGSTFTFLLPIRPGSGASQATGDEIENHDRRSG